MHPGRGSFPLCSLAGLRAQTGPKLRSRIIASPETPDAGRSPGHAVASLPRGRDTQPPCAGPTVWGAAAAVPRDAASGTPMSFYLFLAQEQRVQPPRWGAESPGSKRASPRPPAPFAALCVAPTEDRIRTALGVSYKPPTGRLGVGKLFPSVGSFLERPAAKGILRKGKGGSFTDVKYLYFMSKI